MLIEESRESAKVQKVRSSDSHNQRKVSYNIPPVGVGCEVAILSSSVVRVSGLLDGPSVVAEVEHVLKVENGSIEADQNN